MGLLNIYYWLKGLGVEVFLEEVASGRSNVIGRIPGLDPEKALVYIGHMDTVPAGQGWTLEPFSGDIVDNKLYGRGSSDMKGGLAAGMIVFRHIAAVGKQPKCR